MNKQLAISLLSHAQTGDAILQILNIITEEMSIANTTTSDEPEIVDLDDSETSVLDEPEIVDLDEPTSAISINTSVKKRSKKSNLVEV